MNLKTFIQKFFRFSPFIVTIWWTLAVLIAWNLTFMRMGDVEVKTYDLRFQYRGDLEPDPRIVLIGIDEPSILKESYTEEDGKNNPGFELLQNFPYPRKTYALILEKLVKAGAKVVIFDLLFSQPGSLGIADDQSFQKALRLYHDHVVIGANITFNKIGDGQAPTLTLPHSNILPGGNIPDTAIVGFVNHPLDWDGVIRKMNPHGFPMNAIEYQKNSFEILPYSIDALAVKKAFPSLPIPEPFESRFILYRQEKNSKGETCPTFSLYKLFHKKSWENEFQNGKYFKDKIVLIGPKANFLHDEHLTPYRLMDGPDTHVHAISTLLSGRNLREMSRVGSGLLILIIGNIFAILLPRFKTPLGKVVPALVLIPSYCASAQIAFSKFDCFLPVVPVLSVMVGSTSMIVIIQALTEQMEKRRVSGMLRKYVSKNVADEMIKSGRDVGELLAPRKQTVTILYSDIRDFTTMTENSDPNALFQQLNEYLGAMVDCVFKNQGTLDKFIGDAVMAVFGNPNSSGKETDAWNAVKTAIEMRHKLAELNQRWEKEGKNPFKIGIGLNHGDVLAGDIGSSEKKEYGVIGDTVNTCSRVESLTKEHKVDILMTDSVYELVKDKVETNHLGDIPVKGRAKPVDIYVLIKIKG